ncbi:hypothetical protein [Pseudomonas amygdali]|uniref:hypothetical protein n=1 Tax=Pseudomonas amygdali TaxID=47877 RepID=UPI001673E319|nr:hypothetical protein [Pseudomonas amygdali]
MIEIEILVTMATPMANAAHHLEKAAISGDNLFYHHFYGRFLKIVGEPKNPA